jgi:hypothetical protein
MGFLECWGLFSPCTLDEYCIFLSIEGTACSFPKEYEVFLSDFFPGGGRRGERRGERGE